MFHLIVTIAAKTAADIEPVAAALARMRPLCLSEEGCVRWEAYQSEQDPGCFVLVEHWRTRQLWDAHGDGRAIQEIYMREILPRITRQVHPARIL